MWRLRQFSRYILSVIYFPLYTFRYILSVIYFQLRRTDRQTDRQTDRRQLMTSYGIYVYIYTHTHTYIIKYIHMPIHSSSHGDPVACTSNASIHAYIHTYINKHAYAHVIHTAAAMASLFHVPSRYPRNYGDLLSLVFSMAILCSYSSAQPVSMCCMFRLNIITLLYIAINVQ
jgi:hypothetical protein